VTAAAREAIAMDAISFDVVFALLSRPAQPQPIPVSDSLPEHLKIIRLPVADCGRYDRLLTGGCHAA